MLLVVAEVVQQALVVIMPRQQVAAPVAVAEAIQVLDIKAPAHQQPNQVQHIPLYRYQDTETPAVTVTVTDRGAAAAVVVPVVPELLIQAQAAQAVQV